MLAMFRSLRTGIPCAFFTYWISWYDCSMSIYPNVTALLKVKSLFLAVLGVIFSMYLGGGDLLFWLPFDAKEGPPSMLLWARNGIFCALLCEKSRGP